jgi:magnesium transporter
LQQTIKTSPEKNWEWIDIEDPTVEELNAVARKYGLHPSSVIDCLQPEHLPKFEVINDIIFIITRLYDRQAHHEADTIQELTRKIAIFYSDKFLITIHRRPHKIIDELKEIETGTDHINPCFELLLRVIHKSLETFEVPAQKLTTELDDYEAKIFLQKNIPPLTRGLYHLKRKAAVSKKVLQLSDPILNALSQHNANSPAVHDLNDYFVRIITIYDEINDSVNNLLNMYISLSSQRTNEVMRVLTIFSVFFMPLTFIAGIYGMNFAFMPELKAEFGYPLTMLAMVLVAVGIYLWFRRKGWM